MRGVEPIARIARERAKEFLEHDDRIQAIFELYDATIDRWSLSIDLRSSPSVSFRELKQREDFKRKVGERIAEFSTCDFKLNQLHVQFGKHYYDEDSQESVAVSLSIDKKLVFVITVILDDRWAYEFDSLSRYGTLHAVEEFRFTPKLLELIELYKTLTQEHQEAEDDKENLKLNRIYEGKFCFDGMDTYHAPVEIDQID